MISAKIDITVYSFLVCQGQGQLTFTRWLPSWLFEQWLEMVDQIYSFQFENANDSVAWNWSSKGKFTTKSIYNHLSNGVQGKKFQHIWKSKIPYKIKIFMWLVENNAILTKDNMIRRNLDGNLTCYFCEHHDSIDHLLT
jgi:hypothetical protein